jgi:hypothetical protein
MTPSSSIHHLDVSHHSSIIPINTHHLPITQINITRQSINSINAITRQSIHAKNAKRQDSSQVSQVSWMSETAETAEVAEVAGVAGIVFASLFPWIPTDI